MNFHKSTLKIRTWIALSKPRFSGIFTLVIRCERFSVLFWGLKTGQNREVRTQRTDERTNDHAQEIVKRCCSEKAKRNRNREAGNKHTGTGPDELGRRGKFRRVVRTTVKTDLLSSRYIMRRSVFAPFQINPRIAVHAGWYGNPNKATDILDAVDRDPVMR